MKKILFVCSSLRAGGAERILSYILRYLDRKKFIPHLALFELKGEFLNNVCAVPFMGSKVIYELHRNCNPGRPEFERWYATAAEWNEASEYASGNLDAPVMVDESTTPDDFIQLFYNDSDDPKEFQLAEGDFMDSRGNPVSGSVTVDPWRSEILFSEVKQ